MRVRRRVYESGQVAFQLDLGVVNGRRVQKAFATKEAAMNALRAERAKRERHGTLGDAVTSEEMAEIVVARARLRDCGASLLEAVEFYLLHATRLREEITVAELVRRFREDRAARGKSERYVRQLGVSLGNLARFFPLKKAHEMTQSDVETWLRSNAWRGKTHNNYLGDVAALFEWAKASTRGHVRMNPTREIERVTWRAQGIVALKVEQCEELLREAVKQQRWRVLSHVVLGMLAGIRPAEIERLKWDAIDLNERTVVVMAQDAKTAARRVVDLTEEAVAWLRLIPEGMRDGGRGMRDGGLGMRVIERKGWVDEWTVFRRGLGWDVGGERKHLPKKNKADKSVRAPFGGHGRWPHDALRHTFASMHYAFHQNEALLQVQMGHRSARMLHQHYRAVVTPGEARRFWALRP